MFDKLPIEVVANPDLLEAFKPQIEGRYVLIGGDIPDVDQFITPAFAHPEGRNDDRPEIHATLLAQMLDNFMTSRGPRLGHLAGRDRHRGARRADRGVEHEALETQPDVAGPGGRRGFNAVLLAVPRRRHPGHGVRLADRLGVRLFGGRHRRTRHQFGAAQFRPVGARQISATRHRRRHHEESRAASAPWREARYTRCSAISRVSPF